MTTKDKLDGLNEEELKRMNRDGGASPVQNAAVPPQPAVQSQNPQNWTQEGIDRMSGITYDAQKTSGPSGPLDDWIKESGDLRKRIMRVYNQYRPLYDNGAGGEGRRKELEGRLRTLSDWYMVPEKIDYEQLGQIEREMDEEFRTNGAGVDILSPTVGNSEQVPAAAAAAMSAGGGVPGNQVQSGSWWRSVPKVNVNLPVAEENPEVVTMDDIYGPYEEPMKETQQEMNDAVEMNEEEMRREKSRKVIASLGDAFASFANLWGTTRNAENMKQTYAAPLVSDSIDRARKIRFGRMADLRQKLDAQRDALIQYNINNDPTTLQNILARQRVENAAANAELRGRDIDRKIGNDAANQEMKGRQQDETERANRVKEQQNQQKIDQQGKKDAVAAAQGWSRIANESQRISDQRERSGGGDGTWKQSATANYNAFKEEIARRNGYSSWEDLYRNKRYDPSLGAMLDSIEGATSTDKQKAAISSYAERYAPEFFDQYYRKEQKQYGQEPPKKKGGLDDYGGGTGAKGTSKGGSRARNSYGGR